MTLKHVLFAGLAFMIGNAMAATEGSDYVVLEKPLPQAENTLTKAKYGRLATEFLAMCLLKDKATNVSIESPDSLFVKAKNALYQAYHKKGERWTDGEGAFLATLTSATGISLETFRDAQKDPKVLELCDIWKQSYDVAKIQGIPAYVVNGKYLIMTKSIRSLDQMVGLIKELQAK